MESALNAIFEVPSFEAIIMLIALGLGIIAGMMGVFNFAHGAFVLLGAYATYLAYGAGLPAWPGLLAAPLVVAACGFVLERLVIRRFYAAPIAAMLGTCARKVESVDGDDIPVRAESICVHPDAPGAVSVAKAVRSALADYLGKAA
jgi:branched-subunit amino acid ABC-type transport system permease component